jgi:hypothetical protein
MLCLDYSTSGPDVEPQALQVDQELNYRVTVFAETFEQFVLGLEQDEDIPVE